MTKLSSTQKAILEEITQETCIQLMEASVALHGIGELLADPDSVEALEENQIRGLHAATRYIGTQLFTTASSIQRSINQVFEDSLEANHG